MESQVPGMGVSSGGGSLPVKAHCKEHPCPQPGRAPGAQELSAVGMQPQGARRCLSGLPWKGLARRAPWFVSRRQSTTMVRICNASLTFSGNC